MDEFQKNPLGALSKGWGLFSSAVATAGAEINRSVVQPGMARASDFTQNVSAGEGNEEWKKYLGQGMKGARDAADWAAQRANEGWGAVNEAAKTRGGVDLNEQLGKLGISGRSGTGYGQLERAEDGVLSPHGAAGGDDDFFDSWNSAPSSATTTTTTAATASKAKAPPANKANDWTTSGRTSRVALVDIIFQPLITR
jgi:ADP-ribosylation factor GTPase-activating protein 1